MELTTSIVILAPHEVQAVAVQMMREYCLESLICVPAHITVLYPFVPYEQIDEAADILREICAQVEPFDVTMRGYSHFARVAYMQPHPIEPIQALFRKIYARFPQCPPYRGQFGDELVPHMTVGEFASDDEHQRAALHDYEPITFSVTRLHLMYGVDRSTLPWLTHAVIPLKEDA